MWIVSLVKEFFGRNAMMTGLIAGCIALAFTYDTQRVNHGKTLANAENLKKAGEANAEDFAAHNRARRPGSFERLRARYCDDCVD